MGVDYFVERLLERTLEKVLVVRVFQKTFAKVLQFEKTLEKVLVMDLEKGVDRNPYVVDMDSHWRVMIVE